MPTVTILVVSYLPPMVGLAIGIGHCETCRDAWLKFVWILHGTIICFLSRIDASNYIGLAWAVFLQLVWLVGWTWLAVRGKIALGVAATLAFGISVWITYLFSALVRW